MVAMGGGGSLLRHKFTMTHVTFLKKEIGIFGLMNVKSGFTTPICITKSRHCGPSPEICEMQHIYIQMLSIYLHHSFFTLSGAHAFE